MNSMCLSAFFKKLSPFLVSLCLHLFFFMILCPLVLPLDTSSGIEIQIHKSLEKQAPHKKTTSSEKNIFEKSSAKSKSLPDWSAGSKNQNDNPTALLGSEIGIHVTYPRISRALKEQGQVLIGVEHNSSLQAKVAQSSGFVRLDESALSATQQALKSGLLTDLFVEREKLQIRFIFKLTE